MNKNGLKATNLRAILIVCVLIALIGNAIGFLYAKRVLTQFAVDVSHSLADSKASANNVDTLKTIQKELVTQKDNETKASQISSPVGSYQNQVITDIDNYAALTGVSVDNYSFATAAAATATPAAASSGSSTAAVATGAIAGTSTVTVTIGSPVAYTSLLKFIRAIEGNLPKMQISSVNIGRSTDSSTVTTDTLTIAVFTK